MLIISQDNKSVVDTTGMIIDAISFEKNGVFKMPQDTEIV